MMGKSYCHDKRLSPQGSLQRRHEALALAELIPHNGDLADLQVFSRAIW
jgi:hypothetical protein